MQRLNESTNTYLIINACSFCAFSHRPSWLIRPSLFCSLLQPGIKKIMHAIDQNQLQISPAANDSCSNCLLLFQASAFTEIIVGTVPADCNAAVQDVSSPSTAYILASASASNAAWSASIFLFTAPKVADVRWLKNDFINR